MATLGFGAVGASQAQAACGVEGTIAVSKNGDGSRYVRGSGNAYCSPPVAANHISVNVSAQNILLSVLLPGHSSSASCNSGSCSITPIFWGYTVPANALAELINGGGAMCFSAQYIALSGGGRTVTSCG
ncbi:MAG: hypothetical protein WD844_15110 [Thermoleophilaceae bacterium]